MTVMLLVAKSMWKMASKARIYMGTNAASICFAYSLILSVTSQVSAWQWGLVYASRGNSSWEPAWELGLKNAAKYRKIFLNTENFFRSCCDKMCIAAWNFRIYANFSFRAGEGLCLWTPQAFWNILCHKALNFFEATPATSVFSEFTLFWENQW